MSDYLYIVDRFDDLKYYPAFNQLVDLDVNEWLHDTTVLTAVGDIVYRLLDIRGNLSQHPYFTGSFTDIDTSAFHRNLAEFLLQLEYPYHSLFSSIESMFSDADGVGLCLDFLTSELQFELLYRHHAFSPAAFQSEESGPEQSSPTVSSEGDETLDEFKLDSDQSAPSLLAYFMTTMGNINTSMYNLDVHFHVQEGKTSSVPVNDYTFSLQPSHQMQFIEQKMKTYAAKALLENPSLFSLLNTGVTTHRLFPQDAFYLTPAQRQVFSELSERLYEDYAARRAVVIQKMIVMTQTFLFSIKYHFIQKNQNASDNTGVWALNKEGVGSYSVTDPEFLEMVAKIKAEFGQVLRQMTYSFPATHLDLVHLTWFPPRVLTNVNTRHLERSRHKSSLMSTHPKGYRLPAVPDRDGRIPTNYDEIPRKKWDR